MSFSTLLSLAFAVGVGGALYVNFDRMTNSIAQTLVDASKLKIDQITITSCTDTSFTISLTAQIYATGPLPATITDMHLALYATSPSTGSPPFAQIALPPLHAHPTGTVCRVVDQPVTILDRAAFHAFNKHLVLQAELPAYVRGTGTLRALACGSVALLRTEVVYDKVEVLAGLDGVHIRVHETRKASRSLLKGKPTAIEVDVSIVSESQVSVDMGAVQVAIMFSGVRIATVQCSELFLKKGDNRVTFTGSMDFVSIGKNLGTGLKFLKKDVLAEGAVEAYVVGVEGKQCAWLNETVQLINSRIEMGSTMADLVRSIYSAEEAED